MKTLMLTALCALMYATSFAAKPIFRIHRENKGWFGYRYVHFELVTDQVTNEQGWVGDCHNPGRDACRVGVAQITSNNDQAEINAVNELLRIADGAIDNKDFSGTETLRVKVEGETLVRLYRVIWNTDDYGDGTILVEREDGNF